MFDATLPRGFARTCISLTAATALLTGLSATVPAHADSAVSTTSRSVVVTGAGWGHGKGMSQYGAYGAAKKGLAYNSILSFYYPGTSLKSTSAITMRVWITDDTNRVLLVHPAKGLQVYDSSGHKLNLPYSSTYTRWKVARSTKTGNVLYYRSKAGKWVRYSAKLVAKQSWLVRNTRTATVGLVMPGGKLRTYSGALGVQFRSGTAITVNYVNLETYLRSVVPSEMPSSWGTASAKGFEALKAQSVAARTYALREKAAKTSSYAYDICDTSACQVYKDNRYRATTSDQAIAKTARRVLYYGSKPALTQFTSSNGGWTAAYSGYPYLVAKKDPYDPIHTWTKTIAASSIEKAYSKIGTLKSVQVTARTGVGPYASKGRTTAIKLVGTKGSISISGSSFKSKFGLKETLFAFSAK